MNKHTQKALLISFVSLLLCIAMLVGTTFAWFTDSVTSGNNRILAGNLDVELTEKESGKSVTEVQLFDDILWEPGVVAYENLTISNVGTLALKYRFTMNWNDYNTVADTDKSLKDVLTVAIYDGHLSGTDRSVTEGLAFNRIENAVLYSDDTYLLEGESKDISIVVYWEPSAADDDYNLNNGTGNSDGAQADGHEYLWIDLGLDLIATQKTEESDSFGNDYDKDATWEKAWDGTSDTSWYNEEYDEYILNTAEQLAGFSELVDGGNTFEGKIVKLDSDIDLLAYDSENNKISFDPIGYGYDVVFKGTFDGQNHTIRNLYQNGWSLGLSYSTEGGGLFASVVDATIKNLSIDNAEVVMECIDMGTLVGYSYGNCTYENISVSNSTIANYQRYTGGIVGEVNGTQSFKNVDVDAATTVSSLWGDFDCSLGGIVGGKYGDSTLTFEDCDVACTINAYNDVTSSYQWYAYRRAGMLIGNSEEASTQNGKTSATATYLTTKNCTVTYGDWANYTYCEFAGQNWPYVRVQAGYSSDAYSNPRYGVAVDANGNKVVDENHVHNEGEDHNILCVFDQLYGGGQGVYGTATHEGVTVIYNNK